MHPRDLLHHARRIRGFSCGGRTLPAPAAGRRDRRPGKVFDSTAEGTMIIDSKGVTQTVDPALSIAGDGFGAGAPAHAGRNGFCLCSQEETPCAAS